MIAGIIVWMLHERFHNIRLPDALVSSAVRASYHHLLAGDGPCRPLVIPLVWPIFAMGISGLAI